MKRQQAQALLEEVRSYQLETRAELQGPQTGNPNGNAYRLIVRWRDRRVTIGNLAAWESIRLAWQAAQSTVE